jgi:hypothetical protein
VPATDLEGNLIPDLDGHPPIQGARVDIGAYETAPETEMLALAAIGALYCRAPRDQPKPLSLCLRALMAFSRRHGPWH